MEGALVSATGRRYDIRGGVPRMVPEDAVDGGQQTTREAFSNKWVQLPEFGHEAASRDFYRQWYFDRYKFGTIEGLERFLEGKRRVLDAGTGLGRDSRMYAEHSSAEVFGVDISASIDIAYGHLREVPNLHLIQADLTQLPFEPGFFDLLACDQVLHHTKDTHESLTHLATRLAPGGDIMIYVYRRKALIRELADDHLRSVVQAMPEREAWRFSEQLTELGKVLSDANVQIEVPDIPALGIKGGSYDLQRFIYWNVLKCYWNPTMPYETSVSTNFDWYRPLYAHRHTPEEVRGWFEGLGFEVKTFDEVESGISVRARRPGR